MTMVQHKSELSMSRTGIHGGIRRGAAAAAIGAVLVLSTGASASQAEEGTPDPGDSAAPAVDTKSLPLVASLTGQHGREDAPGQNRDKNPKAGGNGKPGARPAVSASASASAVPSALLPAITATQSPASGPATATPSPVPTADAPASTPTATRPATSPAGSGPASPGTSPAPASSGPAQASAPASSAALSPAGGTPAGTPVQTPAAGNPTSGAPAVQMPGAQETPARAAAQNGQVGSNAAQLPGGQETSGTETSAGTAPGAAAPGNAAYLPLYAVPQANSEWAPSYSAGALGNSVRSSAELKAQPEPKSALVWLGSGLVGVAGAAGLVFFRLRNP
ncbi:hypothetical protein [Pseudarthrobacter siccitolerans]|nr:hypothetical protein [Pseudarthrobacter siccitolerans]